MAFTELKFGKYASDLVIGHLGFHFSNEDANITPGPVVLGTVVSRAKGGQPDAPYAIVASAGDIVDTNEYAVVFGDHYAFKEAFTPKPIVAGKWNALVIARDAAFKEFYIKENYATLLGDAPYALMKKLMADQGLLVLDDVSDYVHTI
jgi:hypothetical protein